LETIFQANLRTGAKHPKLNITTCNQKQRKNLNNHATKTTKMHKLNQNKTKA